MEALGRHERRQSATMRWRLLLALGWSLMASLPMSVALNCALPQPQLAGVQNATAVQLPVDIILTTAPAAVPEDLLFVATHNGRNIPWGKKITINDAVTVVTSRSSPCSRTDFFVFDGYFPHELPSNGAESESLKLQCLATTELHLLIMWSGMPNEEVSGLFQAVAALSDIVTYPEADFHVRLLGVFRVDPEFGHFIDESWYQAFYGDTDYGLYFGASGRVDMTHVKGSGAFHVALVEDLCPKYAYDLKHGMELNINMLALKNLLREHSTQWFQVHTTQTREESDASYTFLFGEPGKEIFQSLRLDRLWSAAKSSAGLRVDRGVYILPWRRVFIPVDAMEMIGAMMQSEWYRFELDVPEIHAELTPGMLDPDPTSSQENILRTAFLGSSRLPLLAHLPGDSRWYKAKLELKHVKNFRILKENSWGQQLPPCSTVEEAADILGAHGEDTATPDEGSLRDHIRQLEHRLDHFNHTVIVVGASVDGPFTIWDGNHRAIALALTQPDSHLLLVYTGLSAKFAAPHRGSLYCP